MRKLVLLVILSAVTVWPAALAEYDPLDLLGDGPELRLPKDIKGPIRSFLSSHERHVLVDLYPVIFALCTAHAHTPLKDPVKGLISTLVSNPDKADSDFMKNVDMLLTKFKKDFGPRIKTVADIKIMIMQKQSAETEATALAHEPEREATPMPPGAVDIKIGNRDTSRSMKLTSVKKMMGTSGTILWEENYKPRLMDPGSYFVITLAPNEAIQMDYHGKDGSFVKIYNDGGQLEVNLIDKSAGVRMV